MLGVLSCFLQIYSFLLVFVNHVHNLPRLVEKYECFAYDKTSSTVTGKGHFPVHFGRAVPVASSNTIHSRKHYPDSGGSPLEDDLLTPLERIFSPPMMLYRKSAAVKVFCFCQLTSHAETRCRNSFLLTGSVPFFFAAISLY